MPHIAMQLSGIRNPDVVRGVVHAVNALTESILGKQPAVMSTTVQTVADEDWFIAGRPLSEIGGSAFDLAISITDETNTKAEKARYLREVHAAMARLLPGLHETSYIHLVDARAAAYGYGGRTQEWRHQQAGV
ncbi:hypothetical protein [Xylophilus sp. Leaf220]|uniref:tautomerase family protein n=1 Tax=Xylophilus sp. Leaf220 TaxID=1735686 RepID=UPI0006FED258|nr:hypothetical protein [Xylophilus sp. Leaf220]KQM71359.1 4-oxalocrotonate tautomerase [Xylophilus sp. Leaf220]